MAGFGFLLTFNFCGPLANPCDRRRSAPYSRYCPDVGGLPLANGAVDPSATGDLPLTRHTIPSSRRRSTPICRENALESPFLGLCCIKVTKTRSGLTFLGFLAAPPVGWPIAIDGLASTGDSGAAVVARSRPQAPSSAPIIYILFMLYIKLYDFKRLRRLRRNSARRRSPHERTNAQLARAFRGLPSVGRGNAPLNATRWHRRIIEASRAPR